MERLILPQYQNAKIILPGEGRVITPERWDGDIVVHAPLRHDIETLLLEARARAKFFEDLRNGNAKFPPIAGGAAGTWTFTNTGRTSLLNGTFDIDSDTWKMALFLSTSDLAITETTYAGVTNEVSQAFGYLTGGASIALTLAGTTTVTVDITTDPVWTASGGSITARFAAIYEVSGNVLCFALLDSTPADVTATDGNTLTVAANASGVFTLA